MLRSDIQQASEVLLNGTSADQEGSKKQGASHCTAHAGSPVGGPNDPEADYAVHMHEVQAGALWDLEVLTKY